MAYSTSKLGTKEDCDLVLEMAAKQKADLEYKKTSEQRQQKSYTDNSVGIDAELQSLAAEIAATTTIIENLPDGPTKLTRLKRKKSLSTGSFYWKTGRLIMEQSRCLKKKWILPFSISNLQR